MQPSVRKKSWMNRFIDTIEYWGNKLPHPFILFGMLVVITLIGSWILSQAGCSITYMAASRTPGEPEKEVTIAVTNLLSGENLRYLITKYPDIFIGYPPMKLVLVMMAATAFIEKTGFFGTFMKKYLLRAPRGLVTFAVVFVGVNSNLMSDAGTLFALTMGGIIFAALGRNPLIGVILGWASSSGGFTANLFLAGTDALLAGITEGVVKEMGVAVDINPAMNYFFMASATFFLSVTLTLFTEKVVCRMVGDGDGKVNMALLEEHKLTADQEKGLRWAFPARGCWLKGSTLSPQTPTSCPNAKAPSSFSPGALKRFIPLCQFSARRPSIFRFCVRLSARSAEKPGSSGVMAAINKGAIIFSVRLACRGAVSRPSQVRLEPESAELFQDCIK